MASRLAVMSSRIAVCGQQPVSTAAIRSSGRTPCGGGCRRPRWCRCRWSRHRAQLVGAAPAQRGDQRGLAAADRPADADPQRRRCGARGRCASGACVVGVARGRAVSCRRGEVRGAWRSPARREGSTDGRSAARRRGPASATLGHGPKVVQHSCHLERVEARRRTRRSSAMPLGVGGDSAASAGLRPAAAATAPSATGCRRRPSASLAPRPARARRGRTSDGRASVTRTGCAAGWRASVRHRRRHGCSPSGRSRRGRGLGRGRRPQPASRCRRQRPAIVDTRRRPLPRARRCARGRRLGTGRRRGGAGGRAVIGRCHQNRK